MINLLLRRVLQMILIMLTASLILFVIFDTPEFKKRLAVQELGGFAVSALTEASYQGWLESKGLNVPFYERYGNWIGSVVQGDLGFSYEKNRPVGPLLLDKLKNTGILAFWVFALMVPLSLVLGVFHQYSRNCHRDLSDGLTGAGPWSGAGQIVDDLGF